MAETDRRHENRGVPQKQSLGTTRQRALIWTCGVEDFGRVHIGAVKGLASTITVAGTAAGPLILAVGYDVSGSYAPVLAFSAIVPAVVAMVSPFLPLKRGDRIL